MAFQKASKKQCKLRLAISGPAGSGKTYSALAIASGLGKKIAVIDTERGSASKYADKFSFDVCELAHYSPLEYVKAIKEAEENYDVIIIDSLSHAWNGEGGVLEVVSHNFNNWQKGTPLQNQLVAAITGCKCHVIGTMRAKMDYVVEEVDGKKKPRKVGLAPVQRDDTQYEFDVHAFIDMNHVLTIDKTRCEAVDGRTYLKPGADLASVLKNWLNDGAVASPSPASGAGSKSDTIAPSSGPSPAAAQASMHDVDEVLAKAEEKISAPKDLDSFSPVANEIKKLLATLKKPDADSIRPRITDKYNAKLRELSKEGK